MTTTQQNILIIKLGALGDFIQALGPMNAIRTHHPDAHITLLTTQPFEKFAKDCGYVDNIWLDNRPKFFNPIGWLNLRKKLNSGGFKRVYDLQNNDRTNLYFKLFNPRPEWVGIAKGASHRNASKSRTKGDAFNGHVQTLALAEIQNVEIDKLEWMNDDLSNFALKPPYILLVPGCAPNRPEKRWPARHYGELANILMSMNLQPVIIGTSAEKEAAETIIAACPNALDLTNQTNFHQVAALARNASGAIGNDTGPMHIIGPTGCPSLVLFSHTSNPAKHTPKGDNISVVQKENLESLSAKNVIENFKPTRET